MTIAINWFGTIRKIWFRSRRLALIVDIPDKKVKEIFDRLVIDGWVLTSKYDGFDAGIDYDCLKLRKGLATVKCEWNNWTEWEILGRRDLVERIAIEFDLQVSYF
jgi:hypothetical protein